MAVAINHSDPGAVPGASTQAQTPATVSAAGLGSWSWKLVLAAGLGRGRNRIDEGVKGVFFLGMVPPLSGYAIVANDNYAPVAQAA